MAVKSGPGRGRGHANRLQSRVAPPLGMDVVEAPDVVAFNATALPPSVTAVLTTVETTDVVAMAAAYANAVVNATLAAVEAADTVALNATFAGLRTATLATTETADTVALTTDYTAPGLASNGFVTEGDSITEVADGVTTSPWPVQLATMTGMSVMNNAGSGETLANMNSQFASQVSPDYNASTRNTAVIAGGINDILLGGANAAGVRTQADAWVTSAAGVFDRVGVATLTPVDAANPSWGWAGGDETARTTYNAGQRTSLSPGADFLADFDADARLSDSTDLAVYYDGLHPTVYGAGVRAEIVAAAAGVTHVKVPVVAWGTGRMLEITTSDTIGAGWRLYVQVDDSSGFGSPAIDTFYDFTGGEDLNTVLSGLITGLSSGTWYARVKLRDASNRVSPWSRFSGPQVITGYSVTFATTEPTDAVALNATAPAGRSATLVTTEPADVAALNATYTSAAVNATLVTTEAADVVALNASAPYNVSFAFTGPTDVAAFSASAPFNASFAFTGPTDAVAMNSTYTAPAAGHRYLRMTINSSNGAAGVVVQNMVLKEAGVSKNSLISAITATNNFSGHPASDAVNSNGWWSAFDGSFPINLNVDFGSGNAPAIDRIEITIAFGGGIDATTTINAVDVKYSDDASSYTTNWSEASSGAWSSNTTKVFEP